MANVPRLSFEDQISQNKLKSFLLIVIILVFFIAFGYVIASIVDPSYFFIIMIISIIFSISYTIFGYYNSASIALASVHARPASESQYHLLHNAVENMSIASGLPKPKVYVMDSGEINAFASGRDPAHAVICVTTGALQKLNKQELEGVIAHEMSHIANFDIRYMTLAAVLIGMISIIAQIFLRGFWFRSKDDDNKGSAILMLIGILFAILAPIAAQLVSLALSRKREFLADATGVKLTRYPTGLASALKKIKREQISQEDLRNIPKAVAPLFMSDPYRKKIQTLFSTHPDIDTRIKRLESM